MKIIIKKSTARGKIAAPPSKSMAHRSLICAALSGNSRVCNIDYSNDVLATLSCLKALGANIKKEQSAACICGLDIFNPPAGAELNCLESGSTLRFMIPLCLLSGKKITLKGSPRLFERPLAVYEDICLSQGIEFLKTDTSLTLCGKLRNGEYEVAGDISSQFITGLLFALPLLKGDSIIKITGKFESASYVDLTLKSLKEFGIEISREGNNIFKISGGQRYLSQTTAVEGDYSNAAFLDAFNLLGGEVEVTGLDDNSLQGDRIYKGFFKKLKNGKKSFDLSDCPDLAPVMFAVSAFFGGAEFSGTKRLRIKESDRAAAMAEELKKFGAETIIYDNSVIIKADSLCPPNETLSGHNDHRIVMALSLLCSVFGGEISGAEAVSKSYPEYFSIISSLGVELYEA